MDGRHQSAVRPAAGDAVHGVHQIAPSIFDDAPRNAEMKGATATTVAKPISK